MEVVFTIGLAIELAGATLLSIEAMTTARDTVPSSGTAEEETALSRAFVGFVLLALGVVVQVVGYAVEEPWLVADPALVTGTRCLASRLLAELSRAELRVRRG